MQIVIPLKLLNVILFLGVWILALLSTCIDKIIQVKSSEMLFLDQLCSITS